MNNFLCVNAQMYKFELQKTIHARKTLAVSLKDDTKTKNFEINYQLIKDNRHNDKICLHNTVRPRRNKSC